MCVRVSVFINFINHLCLLMCFFCLFFFNKENRQLTLRVNFKPWCYRSLHSGCITVLNTTEVEGRHGSPSDTAAVTVINFRCSSRDRAKLQMQQP